MAVFAMILGAGAVNLGPWQPLLMLNWWKLSWIVLSSTHWNWYLKFFDQSMISLASFIDFSRMPRIASFEVPVFRVELLETGWKVWENLLIWSQSYLDLKSSWSFRTPKSLEGCQNEPNLKKSSKTVFFKFQFFQLFSTTNYPFFFLNRAIWMIWSDKFLWSTVFVWIAVMNFKTFILISRQ